MKDLPRLASRLPCDIVPPSHGHGSPLLPPLDQISPPASRPPLDPRSSQTSPPAVPLSLDPSALAAAPSSSSPSTATSNPSIRRSYPRLLLPQAAGSRSPPKSLTLASFALAAAPNGQIPIRVFVFSVNSKPAKPATPSSSPLLLLLPHTAPPKSLNPSSFALTAALNPHPHPQPHPHPHPHPQPQPFCPRLLLRQQQADNPRSSPPILLLPHAAPRLAWLPPNHVL